MLTYLHSKYGRLTSQDIDEINNLIKSPISGETEFETFVQKIEDGQEAVALQKPYTDTQILTIRRKLDRKHWFLHDGLP